MENQVAKTFGDFAIPKEEPMPWLACFGLGLVWWFGLGWELAWFLRLFAGLVGWLSVCWAVCFFVFCLSAHAIWSRPIFTALSSTTVPEWGGPGPAESAVRGPVFPYLVNLEGE